MDEKPDPSTFRRGIELLFKAFTGRTRKLAEKMAEQGRDRNASVSPEAFEGDTNGSEVEQKVKRDQHERGASSLIATFTHRWWTYFPVFSVPLVIATSSWIWFDQPNLNLYAAFYQIFGAIIIARGILRDPREIDRKSMSVLPTGGRRDASERLLAAFETTDAVLGIGFLILGYTLELFNAEGAMMTVIVLVAVVLGWWATTEPTPAMNE